MSAALLDALVALAAVAWLVFLGRAVLVAARMYQIEEYEARRLFAWGRTREWVAHRSVTAAATVSTIALVETTLTNGWNGARYLAAGGWLLASVIGAATWTWLDPKKELVFTPRMRRLLGSTAVVGGAIAAGVCLAVLGLPAPAGALLAALASAGATVLAETLLVTGNIANTPAEAAVRRRFLRLARRRIIELDPLVIAVAGSYGKTSTKHILAHLLSRYGPTLATPKSFNTLLGVCRTVNDVLSDEHRTFIVEMDAYAPGEIAAICDLVSPRHALVTSVGPQHLERFATMKRIEAALYEVIAPLPPDGVVVVYGGDMDTAALAQRARADGRTVTTYGIDTEGSDVDVVARDVRVTGSGSRFTWDWEAEGLRHDVLVPLLGRHQVLNVSAALATVHRLGLPLQPALDAVASLQPVDHRLQPVATGNAITVIDDSYNANPVGVHNGLEVLAQLDAGKRILVTPGLVELGSVEEAENRRYGEHAAAVCDHVIVMDAQPGRALREGLRDGGMSDQQVHVVRSLAEATAVIGRIAVAGDAVLFANDLPDTYMAKGGKAPPRTPPAAESASAT